MIGCDFIEASFDSNKTDTYKLSILAGMDSFAFMVVDAQGGVQLAKKISLDNPSGDAIVFGRLFNGLLAAHPWLTLPYDRVRFAWFSSLFTLVPQRLYVEAAKGEYFRHLTRAVGSGDVFLDHQLSRLSATGVFALDKGLQFLVALHFPQAQVFPFSAVYLDALLSLPVTTNRPRLFVYLTRKHLLLTVLDGSQLRLHNYFSLSGENDLLYYCLLVIKQFGMNPDTDPVYVSGDVNGDHAGFRLLSAYVSRLDFVRHPFSATFGPEGRQLPLSPLFDLLCVSHHE